MITRIDEKNGEKYNALFAKANRALELTQDSEGYINSLNTYFSHMRELVKLAEESGDKSFLIRLPLDEPLFEINANTRTITVPAALRQVGVIGDKKAEILFFRIDRYYDHKDLNNCEPWIEWEYNGEKGKTIADTYKDIQTELDKIIFGWTIDDTLTKDAGTIKFAIHFIDRDENETPPISYRFSSLPAQITVASTLSNLDEINELTDNRINWRRISNSVIDEESDTAEASIPMFVDQPDIDNNIVNLTNNTYKFVVEAGPLDGLGDIKYNFYKEGIEEPTLIVAETDKEEVSKEIVPYRQYFKKLDDDTLQFISLEEIPNTDNVYRQFGYINVNKPGTYYAVASNEVGGRKAKTKKSNSLIIPEPELPEIKTFEEYPEQGFVLNKKEYTIENINNEVVVTELPVESSSSVTLNGIDFIKDPKPLGEFTYNWFKDDSATAISQDASLTVNEIGNYKLKVKNHFNNEDSAWTELETVYKVSNMPVIPDNIITLEEINTSQWLLKSNLNGVEGNIEFEVRLITGDTQDTDEVIAERAPLAEQLILEPELTGTYYIVIYNTLNGATAIKMNNWKFEINNN